MLMTTRVKIVTPEDSDWKIAIEKNCHDFYHLPTYSALESARLQAIPQGIIIEDGEKHFFLPYLLRSCNSVNSRCTQGIYDVVSPYGYPGFILNDAGIDTDFLDHCFKTLRKVWYDQNICSAFIRLHPIINNSIFQSSPISWDFIHIHGDIVVCDLRLTEQQIWQQTRTSHRTKINKLCRLGFEPKITMAKNINSLAAFIQIYEETMFRVGADSQYFFGDEYFANLTTALSPKLYVCEIETENQIVAASLITESRGIVQYHLGGTKNGFLKQSPSTLMFNYITTWAKKRGNSYFNLGGGVGNKKDSLYHFKSGFSNTTEPYMTMRMIVNEDLYNHLIKSAHVQPNIPSSMNNQSSFFPAYRS
jgi:Acetyltransferase (GNAT) domain